MSSDKQRCGGKPRSSGCEWPAYSHQRIMHLRWRWSRQLLLSM